MSVNLPADQAHDIRDPIVGNSYTWDGVEPAANKVWFAVHATGVNSASQDGFTMANYHVNTNGWGGIGVHFVCTQDDYPGDAAHGLPPGAQIQYVGDLLSWRAGILNVNPGKVHIEICGLFTPGNGVPSENQLKLVRNLIEFLLAPNNLLPSFNHFSQVGYHNQLAEQPNGATACPGWQHPQFGEWFGYLQGGPEPSWWHPAPAPVPTPTPTPPIDPTPHVTPTPDPGQGSVPTGAVPDGPVPINLPPVANPVPGDIPDFKSSYKAFTTPITIYPEFDTQAVDMLGVGANKAVLRNKPYTAIGTMTKNGKAYYRGSLGWYGIYLLDAGESPVPDTSLWQDLLKSPLGTLIRLITKRFHL